MVINKTVVFSIAVFLYLICFTAFAASEDSNTNTLSPYFYIENGDPSIDRMPLKSTDVKVNIKGVIAEVTVRQQYANNGTRPINGKYVFPASTRAAVHHMQMKIGDDIITAKIREKETAQKEFNEARKAGKSASLLKQHRPNVFSMNLSNIMPGDTIDIELGYTELLVPTDMTYEFVYSTVTGSRYSGVDESEATENSKWIKNPYLKQGEKPDTKFNIETEISTGIPLQYIQCTTHETQIIFNTDSEAKIQLKDMEQFGGDRDYILKYRLAGEKVQSGVLVSKGDKENFLLVMLEPPQNIKPEDIPPREYIFVVDVSGSMSGFPLNTAKKLLKDLIGDLKEDDIFNVVLFAGSSRTFSETSVPANDENINKAIWFIEQTGGGGGTELFSAMKHSFSIPKNENFSRSMLVIIDGYIGAEKDVFKLISKNLNDTNVFAFGIGSSVNRYLIEGISESGQGEPFVVTSPHEAKETASKFKEYVNSPVLTDISVKFGDFNTYDVEPLTIPDLFAQRPVIVFGKWRGAEKGFK